MSWIAAKRYAQALMDIGIEKGTYKIYADELAKVQAIITKVPILKATLLNISFSTRSRRDLLRNILERIGVSKEVYNFFSLLVERDRLRQLPIIIQHYQTSIDELEGRVRVCIYSTIPLDHGQTGELTERLQETLRKHVSIENRIDQEMIGGTIIKINNILIDNSIRTHFARLAETLMKE
jgi:F-type H+-transporting ATPase subunit delta